MGVSFLTAEKEDIHENYQKNFRELNKRRGF